MKYCGNCGKLVDDSARFCPDCGKAIAATTSAKDVPVRSGYNKNGHNEAEKKALRAKPFFAIIVFIMTVLVVFGGVMFFEDNGMAFSTAFIAAFTPGLLLLWYIWRLDSLEREPVGLLAKIWILGALSTIVAIVLEMGMDIVWEEFEIDSYTTSGVFLYNIIAIGVSEEFSKYLGVKLGGYKSRHFDYMFDGIVYGAVSALGFAMVENLLYVLDTGLSTALVRSALCIPGHTAYGILMGCFIARAKRCSVRHQAGASINKLLAIIVPAIVHGVYDGLCDLSDETEYGMVVVVLFAALVNAVSYMIIRNMAKEDERIA